MLTCALCWGAVGGLLFWSLLFALLAYLHFALVLLCRRRKKTPALSILQPHKRNCECIVCSRTNSVCYLVKATNPDIEFNVPIMFLEKENLQIPAKTAVQHESVIANLDEPSSSYYARLLNDGAFVINPITMHLVAWGCFFKKCDGWNSTLTRLHKSRPGYFQVHAEMTSKRAWRKLWEVQSLLQNSN